jgi:hypothetical protein
MIVYRALPQRLAIAQDHSSGGIRGDDITLFNTAGNSPVQAATPKNAIYLLMAGPAGGLRDFGEPVQGVPAYSPLGAASQESNSLFRGGSQNRAILQTAAKREEFS